MSYSLLLTTQFFPSKRCPGLRRILLHRAILALVLLHAVLIHLDLLTLTRHTQKHIGQTGMPMTGIELGLITNETAWLMTIPAGEGVVALNLTKLAGSDGDQCLLTRGTDMNQDRATTMTTMPILAGTATRHRAVDMVLRFLQTDALRQTHTPLTIPLR